MSNFVAKKKALKQKCILHVQHDPLVSFFSYDNTFYKTSKKKSKGTFFAPSLPSFRLEKTLRTVNDCLFGSYTQSNILSKQKKKKKKANRGTVLGVTLDRKRRAATLLTAALK